MAQRVESGCRDCKKCTNSGYANLGRNAGRATAAVFSLGTSEAVMAGTKNCRICGHKLSLHTGVDYVEARNEKPSKPKVDAGWYADPHTARMRWWDGYAWGPYQDEWQATQALQQPSIAVPAGQVPPHEALSRLAELHASGALTDDEFTAAKRDVLGL